jgi:hypothetical protein
MSYKLALNGLQGAAIGLILIGITIFLAGRRPALVTPRYA